MTGSIGFSRCLPVADLMLRGVEIVRADGREDLHEVNRLVIGRAPTVEHVARDVRLALRQYRRAPTFSTVIVLTLGLGIGSAAAMFALVNAVVLRPLPYPQSQALMQVVGLRASGERTGVSPPDYFDLRDRSPAFSGLAAYWTPTLRVALAGEAPERLPAAKPNEI